VTFDDGPHPLGTPATLEILGDHGTPATFFLAGEQVLRYPALAREIVAAGHEVALHCHRHRSLLRLAPGQVRDDMRHAHEAIIDITGRMPRLYRPPYGVLSAAALVLARRHAWETVLWTRWGRDWRASATPASVAADAAEGLRGGEILLLHDADHYSAPGSWATMVAALPRILGRIEHAGFQVVPLPGTSIR
jgi:peptidoglycan-N-acetylglucosamine deacetylase